MTVLDPEATRGWSTPLVTVDLDRFRANVARMARRCGDAGVALRPHVKTHKIGALAVEQVHAGAVGVTCATPREVEVMLAAGVDEVSLAYPVVRPDLADRVRGWRERAQVRVHLDSVDSARVLADAGGPGPVPVLVEVDTGHHRLGRPPGPPTLELARAIDAVRGVHVVGLASHAGHAYAASSPAAMAQIAQDEAQALLATRDLLLADGIEATELSVGSTPATLAGLGTGITETRPGTYALNDATMVRLGAADTPDCATLVVATVLSVPSAERVVIDAGSKVLSTDWVGTPDWLRVLDRPGWHPQFLSEEHGVFALDPGSPPPTVGERVLVVPAHVCTVMNLAGRVLAVEGGAPVGELEVAARGH